MFENLQATSQAAQMSKLSICCCNACVGKTILALSEGDYTSQREVELWEGENLKASFIINGYARKVTDLRFALEIEIIGFYNGPEGFENVDGYELPLQPTGTNILEGEFTKEIQGNEGLTYTLKHFHKYIFHYGVTAELIPMTHILEINTEENFVSNEDQYLFLRAHSRINS